MIRKKYKELLFLLLVSVACVQASDEFLEIMGNLGDLSDTHDQPFSTVKYNIAPEFARNKKVKDDLRDFIPELREYYILFKEHMENEHTSKYLTFNIYNSDMKEATNALYNVIINVEPELLPEFYEWLYKHVNGDMIDYARRLATLYFHRVNEDIHEPPFKQNPIFFTNSETIAKAKRLKMNCGNFEHNEGQYYQYFKSANVIRINSNYSGWNLIKNGIDDQFTYFREDIGLNSFYYGVHLLHPYWKSDAELTSLNPRHAEHYFYCHQKLIGRYDLEKEHKKYDKNNAKQSFIAYNPYLRYKNGLDFPITYLSHIGLQQPSEHQVKIMTSLISMNECINRGFIIMNNGIKINLTEENHTDVIMKLIRANFDSDDTAKYVRAIYGSNGYPADEYNPAPSVLHHPQTSLREPIYWLMMKRILGFIWDYRTTLPSLQLQDYETDDHSIIQVDIPDLETFFEYYQYDIGKALYNQDFKNVCKDKYTYTARQRRLQHEPFTINITLESKAHKDVITRIFLGPPCEIDECFSVKYTQFFELDNFRTKLNKGINIIEWSPMKSMRLFNDAEFNLENESNMNLTPKFGYSIFKFPIRLLIPRGKVDGMKLKLFIIITDVDENEDRDYLSIREESIKIHHECYKSVSYEHDKKPLGFPFHRKVSGYNVTAPNYRFYDITIYHKEYPIDESGYFSKNLYWDL